MQSLRAILVVLGAGILAAPTLADGFHSPLLTNKDPKKWAVTERARLGLDRSDSAEAAPGAGPVRRRAAVGPLVDVLRYLDKRNVLLGEFPNFNYDSIPGFLTETEALLIALGADAVPLLLDTLIADLKGQTGIAGLQRAAKFRERVIHILVAIGEDAVDNVVGRLTDADSSVRNTMLRILREIITDPDFGKDVDDWRSWHLIWQSGRKKDRKAVPRLIAMLEDPDERIRRAAVDALGAIGSRDAAPALLVLLRAEKDAERIRSLIRALARIGDVSAAPALIDLLSSSNAKVRQEAATGLRFLTREMMGFDPRGKLEDRREAIERWMRWWELRSGK